MDKRWVICDILNIFRGEHKWKMCHQRYPVANALHSLFTQVWRPGRIPANWRVGILIVLYEGKGTKSRSVGITGRSHYSPSPAKFPQTYCWNHGYILDTVLATDVDKYSLASARCQPIWRTKFDELDLFLAVAKDCGMSSSLYQSQQSISPCFG